MNGATTRQPPSRRTWRRPLAWLLAAAALGTVFAAYLNPHAVVDLAGRVWSCF